MVRINSRKLLLIFVFITILPLNTYFGGGSTSYGRIIKFDGDGNQSSPTQKVYIAVDVELINGYHYAKSIYAREGITGNDFYFYEHGAGYSEDQYWPEMSSVDFVIIAIQKTDSGAYNDFKIAPLLKHNGVWQQSTSADKGEQYDFGDSPTYDLIVGIWARVYYNSKYIFKFAAGLESGGDHRGCWTGSPRSLGTVLSFMYNNYASKTATTGPIAEDYMEDLHSVDFEDYGYNYFSC